MVAAFGSPEIEAIEDGVDHKVRIAETHPAAAMSEKMASRRTEHICIY